MEKSKERKAKGALLIPLAMIVRARKDLDWEKETELTAQDMDKIKKGILASIWYELEFFERLARAVAKLIAKNDPKVLSEFGKGLMGNMLLNIYRAPMRYDDSFAFFTRVTKLINGTLFNTVKAEFQPLEQGWVFTLSDPDGVPIPELLVPTFRGIVSAIVEYYQLNKLWIECEEEPLLHTKKLTKLTFRLIREGKR